MNWAYFGLGVSAVLFLGWAVTAWRVRPPWQGIVVGIALLLVAMLNAAAPVRGLIDPNYVGYQFGYLSAPAGAMVTVVAGGAFLLAAVGAFCALRRDIAARAIVALASLMFLIVIGVPWATAALTDVSANEIQFGEYLTIPGLVATALLFVMTVLPFAIGLMWSLGRQARA